MPYRIPDDRKPYQDDSGLWLLPLTHGHQAIIDECSVQAVSVCSWFAHLRKRKPFWYATGTIGGKQVRLHRFILGLQPNDRRQVDHIDGNVADNRRCNLRICTNAENNRNKQTARGLINLKGVKARKHGRFSAGIWLNGKNVHLGTFSTPEAAALAYDVAAVKHFGEFAATNQSLGLLH